MYTMYDVNICISLEDKYSEYLVCTDLMLMQ